MTEQMGHLFSKANRKVVLRLLCKRLADLIRLDDDLVDKTVAECRAHAAEIERPDGTEIERLEKPNQRQAQDRFQHASSWRNRGRCLEERGHPAAPA